MKLATALALLVLSGHSFARAQTDVPVAALRQAEAATDARFAVDPWQVLGYTRGTYLPGYGVVFTFELNLIQVTPLSPFHMEVTPKEIKSVHERKIRQLAVLRDIMRDLIVKTASSLTALPGSEQIVFSAHMLAQSYEDRTGLPWRLTMIANKQKILDAVARHASSQDIASLITERKE